MKKFVLMGLAALAVSGAWAITATKEYVDRSTNAVLIAANRYTDEHGGSGSCLVTNVFTNGVSAVAGKVARITIPSTNGFVTASVTNGLCTTTAAQVMANAARDQAMAQADGKFVGYSLVEDSRQIADEYEITVPWSFAGGLYSFVSFDGEDDFGIQFSGTGAMIKNSSGNFFDFYDNEHNKSRLTVDGSPVMTTNMIGSAIIPAVANSDNLWTASNAKLTNTIVAVAGQVDTNTTLFVTNSALTIAQGGSVKWQESFGGYALAASSAASVSCADHSTTFVTATGEGALTITPPAANANGEARDFIVCVNTSGTNALNLAAFTTLYAPEASATNAVKDKVTMLYFTEMKAGEWLMSRQEVERVRP